MTALSLVAGASASWFLATTPQTDSVSVSFAAFTTDASGARMAQFKYVNRSRITIVSADDCVTQIKGLDPGTLTHLHDIRLQPGESQMILLPPPESKGPWRIRIGHWPDDWRTSLKTSVAHGCKRLNIPKRFIPFSLRTIRTRYVWSDWITDSWGNQSERMGPWTVGLAGSDRAGTARE